MVEKQEKHLSGSPSGVATHSGWSHFYVLFSKYRDECIKIGQVVFGTHPQTALKYIQNYHSALYSMAQQIFSFYDSKIEESITKEWIEIGDDIGKTMFYVSDRDFKNQMFSEGVDLIPKDLKMRLIGFFNKIDKLAAEAGLLVGKENKGANEPKKGLIGFQ